MIGNQNAAGSHDVDTAAEFNAKYNKHIDPKALDIWKQTNWDGCINDNRIDKAYLEKSGNYVRTADGKWYDIVNFTSGNIYEKLDRLERDKEILSKAEYEKQKKILLSVLPAPKTVMDFDVSPLSVIAETFMTSEIEEKHSRDTTPGERMNLSDAFLDWLYEAKTDDLALPPDATIWDIRDYVQKKRVVSSRSSNDEQKEANKAEARRKVTARREAAERLFNQYIREQLPLEDQKRLADVHNRYYNAVTQVDYTKIPVFMDGIAKNFKGNPFKANETQIKGVSWLGNQGNGIVAFDVGVGKTITALMAAVNDMQMGRCDRPIICVPKSVYKQNWLAEAAELFPNVKINPLGNFSDIAKYKNPDGTLNIEKGSISICTYEALTKIGFTDETLESELKESFMEALASTTEDDAKAAQLGNKKNQRKIAKDEETIMTKVGKASKAGDNWVNWEDTGFDHITVDEAHNFRNSFSKPRNMESGNANEFKDIPGGSTSMRGLKLFAITQMIQKHNNGRNVHLLTATPFQNSPVEIYNMLSYVAKEQLKEAGIYNFHEFLTQFAELKSEISVDAKSNIVQKNVMKGFKNLQALQRLLNQYIMKVDGEDAGIIRPDKMGWLYDLNMTAEQKDITEKIRAYLEAGPDPEEDPGATLRCINALRQVTLSPSLVEGFEFLDPMAASAAGIQERKIAVKDKDFVKDSPKLSFVCDSVLNLYKQHPDKGQIIHLPQGIEHYKDVKNYLVKRGIPEDAIAFLSPEYLRSGDLGNDDKAEITAAFNDPGNKLKIIIGSDTIKEGVNLNGNTIETYPCMIPWNPTDLEQLIGRSWRQGNHQGMVHITIPLMNDSIDSFMYQKHDEKGTRLETLWNSKAQKIDVDGIDPEELKFSLIKDPKKRADLFIKEKTAELIQKQKIAAATSDKIFTMAGEWKNLNSENNDNLSEIESLKKAVETFNAKTDQAIIEEHDLDFTVSWRTSVYDDFAHVRGKNIKEIRENYGKEIKNKIADAQKSIQRNKGKMETIDNTLRRYNIENSGNMATVERIRKRYSEEAMGFKAQIDAIESNRDQYVQDAARKIKEESKPGISVSEAVGKNTHNVTENLYSMDVVKERIAKEGGKVKKSILVMGQYIVVRKGAIA
jgi:hypothetical protein